MPKKKVDRGVLPFRTGLGNSKAPMSFDEAMDVLMDPANAPPKGLRPAPKGSKASKKPRKKK